MRTIKAIGCGLLAAFVVYLSFSFSCASFDFVQWTDGSRGLCGIIMLVAFFFGLGEYIRHSKK